jgi:hypothetical protein
MFYNVFVCKLGFQVEQVDVEKEKWSMSTKLDYVLRARTDALLCSFQRGSNCISCCLCAFSRKGSGADGLYTSDPQLLGLSRKLPRSRCFYNELSGNFLFFVV